MNESNFALVEQHVLARLSKIKTEKSESIQAYVTKLVKNTDSPDEQVKKISQALVDLERESAKFKYPEYVLLANYEPVIVRLVFHRMLLWRENTTSELEVAWELHLKKALLVRQLEEAKSRLTKFDYVSFLAGKFDAVFYLLRQRPHQTSMKDYAQMRAWQYQKIVQAIDLKLSHLVKTFRKCYSDEESLKQNIDDEIIQLQSIFKNGITFSASDLETELFRLKALTNSWLPDDKQTFLAELKNFLAGTLEFTQFTVSMLNQLCDRYQTTDKASFLTSGHMLAQCLVCYGDWLEGLASGKRKISQSIDSDVSTLFEKLLKAANDDVADFEKRLSPFHSVLFPADDFGASLLAQLNKKRIAWNEVEKFGFFDHLESKELLRAWFNLQCVLNNNPEVQARALVASVKTFRESEMLLEVFVEKYFDPVLHKSLISLGDFQFEVVALIHNMAPDSKTILRLWNAAVSMIGDLCNQEKPNLFVLRDLFESLHRIYESSESRLDDYFQRIDGHYAKEYLSDVKRQFRAKFNSDRVSSTNLVDYTQRLLQLVDAEFEIVRQLTQPVDIRKLLSRKTETGPKFSFGYRKSDREILASKIKMLVVDTEINLLKTDTKVEDLVELLCAKDIELLPVKPIFLNCRTNQFVLIIDEMAKYFSNLTPANIEQSGRFFTLKGKPVTASNLYRAKTDTPKAHRRIKEILQ